MKKIFILLVLVIMFSQISFADSLPQNYPDANIYYEYEGFIYQYNLRTREKVKLIHGYDIFLSHDKTKFIYKPHIIQELPLKTSETYEVYDIKTNSHKFIIENKWGLYIPEEWSPNDSYIIFDHGTDSITGKAVIHIQTGNLISDFVTIDDRYSWISENEIIFENPKKYNPEDSQEVSINTLTLVILNPNLKYPQSETQKVVNKEDYGSYNSQHSYNLRNVISINDFPSYPILSSLPIKKEQYKYFVLKYLSSSPEWVMIECMSKERTDENTSIYNPIFVLNRNNPKLFLFVGNGYSAQW